MDIDSIRSQLRALRDRQQILHGEIRELETQAQAVLKAYNWHIWLGFPKPVLNVGDKLCINIEANPDDDGIYYIQGFAVSEKHIFNPNEDHQNRIKIAQEPIAYGGSTVFFITIEQAQKAYKEAQTIDDMLAERY